MSSSKYQPLTRNELRDLLDQAAKLPANKKDGEQALAGIQIRLVQAIPGHVDHSRIASHDPIGPQRTALNNLFHRTFVMRDEKDPFEDFCELLGI